MKVVSIIGARPQFIKAAGISRALRLRHQEILLHTGQHYDYEMAGIFFDGLELRQPNLNLEVGSCSHGAQTGIMLQKIEEVLASERPDWVLVFGDTNSTLAGALAAAKLHIPIAHIEAGLRSYNRKMPEEINRVVTDHLSDLLLCPSSVGAGNLATEGITRNVHVVGDVMLDVLRWAKNRVEAKSSVILRRLGLEPRQYLLLTMHRSENTDNARRIVSILDAVNTLEEDVVFPIHPRTRKMIEQMNFRLLPHIALMEPVGYVEMVILSGHARLI
jgi:UDP-GlcNAc3NAcA epimerase